jgi:DNA-binding transcriptional MerR regulator
MRGIGQMARESGLTVSALRFYDGAGVLVPARVDPQSNYRWYSDDQVVTARLVARLRRVGMPLADIRRLLENVQTRPVVDQILQAHMTRLEDGLADARRELSAARSLLDQESPMTTVRIRTTAGELARSLSAVRHAVGTDDDLPMLTGVLLDADHDTFRVVASDRYRLAVSAVSGAEVLGDQLRVIAPAGLVDELLGALDPGDAPVAVLVDGDDVTVDVDGRLLHGRRLDHDFPDYRRMLRAVGAHRVDVDVDTLRTALTAAPTRTVRREQDGTEQSVAVLTLGSDGGLSFTPGSPGVLEMGVNREFLLQALDAGGASQLVLDLDGPIAPLAIRDPRRVDDLSMVMPVRLV